MIKEMETVLNKWKDLTYDVLALKEISTLEMARLLTDTYFLFKRYSKKSLCPKKITYLWLEINDFLYFSSLMEEKEKTTNFYCYMAINHIVLALRNGFFEGKFEYPIENKTQRFTIDINNNGFLNFLTTFKNNPKDAPQSIAIKD